MKEDFLIEEIKLCMLTRENKTETKKEHYKLLKGKPVIYLNIFGKYYKKYI
jgi:hypothetical protein